MLTSEVVVNQTQTAILSCEAFGIPTPSISWIDDSTGSLVTESAGITTIDTSTQSSTLLSVLTFLNAARENQSTYTCVGSNGVDNVINTPENDTVALFVQGKFHQLLLLQLLYDFYLSVPVEIVSDPMNNVHFVGGDTSLQCSASGIPEPSISWFKNQQPINDDRITVSSVLTPGTDTVVSTLAFQGLLLADDDDYHCEANNTGTGTTVFTVTSQSAHLTVQRK